MKSKRITVKDIAEKAGVSRGTVDRVLHARGRVAEDARIKVEQAIETLGYRPNLVARSLATQKTYTIATLLPDPKEDPFWEKPQVGIEQAFKEVVDYGIHLDQHFFSLFNSKSFIDSSRKLLNSNPDAIIIATEFYNQADSFFQEANERKIPVLCINTLITEFPTVGYIGQDSFQSGVLAGRLFDLTIQNLKGIVTLNVGARSVDQKHLLHKEQGLRYYFDDIEKNVAVSEIDLIQFTDSLELEKDLSTSLGGLSFEAIFITNSRAYHVVPIIRKLGYTGKCIIGFDLLQQNKKLLQSGDIDFIINQDPVNQGRMAIKSLFNLLLEKQQPESLNFLPLDIVVKENCEFYT